MADALVDFASLEDSAAAATTTVDSTVDTTVADTTTDSDIDTTVADDSDGAADGKDTETLNADGTEKTEEQKAAAKTAAEAKAASDKAIDTKATPDNVRKALKAMRDASPANADVVKQLHGSFERWNAAKAIFPKGVSEMQEAKAFIDSVGGPEGYNKMQTALDAVTATDELLYAADPKLWDNVIDELKSTGHPEALGQLAPSFLSKLKSHDASAYYEAFTPHFLDGLKEVGMNKTISALEAAVNKVDAEGKPAPDIDAIKSIVAGKGGMKDWLNDLEDTTKSKEPVDTPERKKFLAEKEAFEKTKTEDAKSKRTEAEKGIAAECDTQNNKSLGKALGPFLRMSFFKDFPYETKVDLGNGIKDRLYASLKADAAYQTQMKTMWAQKTPDRAKIVQYHNAKIESIAAEIVRTTIQNRYPGYAKGGSAAGRVAAAVVKKTADTKAAVQSVTSGKPIYVASRPENLVREPIKVGSKEYTAADLVTLQIMGKGFVKSGDGKSFKFITWRK